LIDNGLAETKKRLDYKPSLRERVIDHLSTDALMLYASAVMVVTGIIMFSALRYALLTDSSLLQLISVFLIVLIPAISVATGLINWMVSRIVPPATQPKMDFRDGIPEEFKSMVVIPALLTSDEEVQSLVDQLEQHYLRNKDQNLSFTVLADFVDSDEENSPEDALLTERAVALVNALNNRYRVDNNRNPFYFFLRKRQWNPAEEKWMGYERKRGKLSEFNRLLLNLNADTSYIVKLGDLQFLLAVRYVITLDADTLLPPEAASRLIATMAHPLNQAQFSERNERVTSG
jgi:cyclic beta-1,2-glucan synthetase